MTTPMTQRVQKQSIRVGESRSRSGRSAGYAPSMGVNMQQRYIEQSLHSATCAINKLQRDGFSVEGLELGGGGKPRIRISWVPRCVQFGEPSVYSRGNNGIHYETYLVQYEGCQVSWIKK